MGIQFTQHSLYCPELFLIVALLSIYFDSAEKINLMHLSFNKMNWVEGGFTPIREKVSIE